eukprot:gene33285-41076_t
MADIILCDPNIVTVAPTADIQLIYNDESSVFIHGSGFSKWGNTLRFSNGFVGNGVNYSTTHFVTAYGLILHLTPPSHWRATSVLLPSPLTLLAVNTGEGELHIKGTGFPSTESGYVP